MIFTLGHSTLPIEAFLAPLQAYGIERLVDIRAIPRPRYNPQFNDTAFGSSLKARHLQYVHLKALGGLRRPRKDSPNTGWRNGGFRGFADYMQTEEFATRSLRSCASAAKTALRSCAPGGAMALSPLIGGRCAHGAQRTGRRDFIREQLPDA